MRTFDAWSEFEAWGRANGIVTEDAALRTNLAAGAALRPTTDGGYAVLTWLPRRIVKRFRSLGRARDYLEAMG